MKNKVNSYNYHSIIGRFQGYINKNINDYEIKIVVMDLIEEYFYDYRIREKNTEDIKLKIVVWEIFIRQVKNIKIQDINWSLLAQNYNENFFDLMIIYKERQSDNLIDDFLNKLINDYKEKKSTLGWGMYYKLIFNFYNYLSSSQLSKIYKNINEINKYIEFLEEPNSVNTKILNDAEDYKYIRTYILSNIPLKTDYKNLFSIKYYLKSKNKKSKVIFNPKLLNSYLLDLIKNYLLKFSDTDSIVNINFRIFVYFFNESIDGNIFNSINDFNDDIFYKQFEFYSSLDKKLIKNNIIDRKKNTESLLIHFYRYLIEISQDEQIILNISKPLIILICKTACKNALERGYRPIFYNPFEKVPISNKYCIVPNQLTTLNANLRNNNVAYIDLTGINPKYINEVAEYIWYSSIATYRKSNGLSKISEFLKYKETWDEKLVCFEDKENSNIFPREFLFEYRRFIEIKYKKPSTISDVIKCIRGFLNYYQEKYNIDKYDLGILNYTNLDDYDGGTIITKNDLNIIYQEFVRQEKEGEYRRLYTIVFEIFCCSNLRIGEIINLKKDCLVRKVDGSVELEYISKKINKEKRVKLVDEIIIDLIEEAIQINNKNNGAEQNNYIFVSPTNRKVLPTYRRICFYSYFKRVIEVVNDKLERKNYHPYNVRHTFIDQVYKVGKKEGFTIPEMALICDNKYKTAIKHYRDSNYIDDYLEIMAEVTFDNVDVNGEILGTELNDNRIVRDNLGNCKKKTCNFYLGECLICSNFFTSISRIPVFESRLKYLNQLQINKENELEILEVQNEKKLICAYLSKMYKVKEESGDLDKHSI